MARLSIGLRWTLRSTVAMMLVVLAMASLFYRLVEQNVRRDAHLVLHLQLAELAEEVEDHGGDPSSPELRTYIENHLDSASGDLRLGIRLFDESGALRFERGIFEHREVPLLPDLAGRAGRPGAVEVDAGESLPYLVAARRVEGGYVEVAIASRPFLRGILDLRNRFLEVVPLALVLAAGLSFWLTRRSLEPIADMTAAARRISTAQLDEEIPRSGNGDELDALAETLNGMMERIRLDVERLRGFSGTAAHQLRTPLSLLRTRLEIAALAERDPEADQEMIAGGLRDVARLGAAVNGMLRLADSEGGLRPEQRRPVEIGRALADVVDYFEPASTKRGVDLVLGPVAPATVSGDAEWLRELFSNLVDNAVKYTAEGGRVEVSAAVDGAFVCVGVRDSGPGIEPERLGAIFDRFSRGADVEGTPGVGLGLAVAREIARAHGGTLGVESAPGRGSTFRVRLPLA